ncbi:MAG: hypothetical protein UV54_C0025G0002 [Candidatus Beckwithbacteria bacterium GW2011_GWA2_43_10]|uniref:Uncharacterized protein n=1 Tax=Candidatus Beckwithbacteria bacterium GW2011_GWA2_43_10 TaxID=1618369 RepID=A0A0G1C2L1_9BACT|nr:MAG: hypothetical protein UV54_C0025G0002 [Candidatus Beckwithbacteria bacterium GW2011_GWA2_43_10]
MSYRTFERGLLFLCIPCAVAIQRPKYERVGSIQRSESCSVCDHTSWHCIDLKHYFFAT